MLRKPAIVAVLVLLGFSAAETLTAQCTGERRPEGVTYDGPFFDHLTHMSPRSYFTPDERARIRRGATTRVVLVRHGIDFTNRSGISTNITGATISNIRAGHVDTGSSGYLIHRRGCIVFDLRLPENAPLGNRSVTFPHITGGYTLPVQVIRTGVITSVQHMSPVPAEWGREVQLLVRGRDLGSPAFHSNTQRLLGIETRQAGREFLVRLQAIASRGGDFQKVTLYDSDRNYLEGAYQISPGTVMVTVRYPPSTTLAARSRVPGGTASPQPGGSAPPGGTVATAAPDLQPAWSGTPLRHLVHFRKIQESFCSGLSRQPTNQIARMYVNVPSMRWGVTNAGDADVTDPFEIRLEARLPGGTIVVQQHWLAGLRAGETRYFTYDRPQSRTVVARLGTSPTQSERNTYSASGGECVQQWPQPETQYEWQDPSYQVSVDPDGAVANDRNRSNNTRNY